MERMDISFSFRSADPFSRPVSLILQSRPAVNCNVRGFRCDDEAEKLIICVDLGAGHEEKKHDTGFVTSRRCRSVVSNKISMPNNCIIVPVL